MIGPLIPLFGVLTMAQATPPSPSPQTLILGDSLGRAVDQAGSRFPAGGIVAAEYDRGQVTYYSSGHPAPRPGIAPEKIIFEIGSITKVFTGLLLAQAVVERRVALDDPISRYLPSSLSLDPKVAAITLEELSTHTSGLPRMPSNFHPADPLDPYADYTSAALEAFLASYHPDKAPPQPGDYSNLGMGLLGHILERVYQEPYADLVVEKISKPLGLTDTGVNLDDEQRSRFAIAYRGGVRIKPWNLGGMQGAGGLHSTAADLIRFAELMMTPDKNPLREAWALTREPRADFVGEKIGLNVMILERRGFAVYHHGGDTGGYHSELEWSPRPYPHAIAVLADGGGQAPVQLVEQLYSPPGATFKDRPALPFPASKASEYLGVYPINASGRFTVVVDPEGHLETRLTGQGFLPMFYAGHDRFFLRAVPAELQFERSTDGPVDGLTLLQNGREIHALRSAEPPMAMVWLSPEKLEEYAGRYTLQAGVDFVIQARGRTLLARLGGQPAFPVFCDRDDHFVYDVVQAELTFTRAPDGKVDALILHQNGRDQRAARN